MKSYDYTNRRGVEKMSWDAFASASRRLAEQLAELDIDDEVVHESPVWKVGVSPDVRGRRVAVIDEMADTGETMALVAAEVLSQGASKVVTVALVAHTWADPAPDVTGIVTDGLVVFTWDSEVLIDGAWRMHPEIEEALRLQEER